MKRKREEIENEEGKRRNRKWRGKEKKYKWSGKEKKKKKKKVGK